MTRYRVCFDLNGSEVCIWVPSYRPAGWPFPNRPTPDPDPYPWKITVDRDDRPWARDLSILATIDSHMMNIKDEDVRQSLENGLSTALEAVQRSLPTGFEIHVESAKSKAE